MRRTSGILLLALLSILLVTGAAQAKDGPFGSWLKLEGGSGSGHGYIDIPHSAALNPTAGFTFEAWIKLASSTECASIAGKSYPQTWWIGVCGVTLRSYLKGSGSAKDGGVIPTGRWTHIAVTWDGATRRHYINGVLTLEQAETGPLPTNTANVRIGSDVSYGISMPGEIDEVRLWSIARTAEQLNEAKRFSLVTAETGLVAVWALDGNGEDVIGSHDGSPTANFSFVTFPAPPAGAWLTSPGLPGFQAKVRIGGSLLGHKENACIPETLCVSGALPGRSEVFVRVVGPKPNGYLWPTLVKFSTSQVEVWIQQLPAGPINYYLLEGSSGADSEQPLPGLFDKTGFNPL
jgi:hypothetical protein